MMKSIRKFILFIVLIIPIALSIESCSTPKVQYDDAIRIKKDSMQKYIQNPYNKAYRSGSTLRGRVLGISITTYPDSCPITPVTKFITERYVLFVDSMSAYQTQIEKIPLSDVDFVGKKIDPQSKDYGKINLFENYNIPLNPKGYRAVPIDSNFIDPCSDCGCNKFDINLPRIGLPHLRLKCPKRNCGWYFVELRGVYSVYNDFNIENKEIGRDNISGEIAAGFRFGEGKKIGLGIAASNGIKVFDSKKSIDLTRPTVMLHLRYDFFTRCNSTIAETETLTETDATDNYRQDPCDICEKEKEIRATMSKKTKVSRILKKSCIRPFIYGQIGATVDTMTVNLYKLNFSAKCKEKFTANGQLPGFDFSMPISYSLGIGLDIPIVSWLDLSADLSFRSYALGEMTEVLSYTNVPTKRTVNLLVFRFGVTF